MTMGVDVVTMIVGTLLVGGDREGGKIGVITVGTGGCGGGGGDRGGSQGPPKMTTRKLPR